MSDAPADRDGPSGHHPDPVAGASVEAVSQRGSLSREKVLAAAIEVIDSEGLHRFSMRRVAAQFGVEAMALYHYVHGREDLLDGIVEFLIDDLYDDPDVKMDSDDWQDALVRLAHGVRRLALAHPQVFPLIATRPPAAPWLRPPLRSLRWMESFLETLNHANFSDAASVAAYRGFSSFLIGHLLLEVSARGADISPVESESSEPAPAPDLSGYPRLQRLESQLSEDDSGAEFEESLENLIDRLTVYSRR